MTQLIDLGGYIEEGQPVYPGHQTTQFWPSSTHEETGYVWKTQAGETETVKRKLKAQRAGSTEQHPSARTVLVNEHGPTHVDALTHLDPTEDGSIDRLDLEWFYGDAVGVDVSHVDPDDYITQSVLETALDEAGHSLAEGNIITLFTGHRDRHYSATDIEKRHAYLHEYTGLDKQAARWLGEQGVKNIGIDAPSIDHADAMETKKYPAHDMCAEYKVLNMENMANLGAVAGMRYTMCAFPLKLRDGTGSPIRPVAIVDE
ncbi:MAG: cyclase family protein [Halobacteriota archaeon]